MIAPSLLKPTFLTSMKFVVPHNDFNCGENRGADAKTSPNDQAKKPRDPADSAKNGEAIKLIPWEDIWTSLRVARLRGNGEMIDVFYDTLFKEAVFDDDGAWAFNHKKRF